MCVCVWVLTLGIVHIHKCEYIFDEIGQKQEQGEDNVHHYIRHSKSSMYTSKAQQFPGCIGLTKLTKIFCYRP